jgi:uncharacterized protein (DUF1697 family)
MAAFVALLRGINVAAQRKVPMADLRALAVNLGLGSPRTLIASGNLIFESEKERPLLETLLEEGLKRRFGFPVDVMLREAGQWADYCSVNPFPAESALKPNFLLLFVGKEAADDRLVEALRARADAGEKVARSGDALWIYFANGGGRSKLSGGPKPGLWTGRNWRTVCKIQDMLVQPA